MFIGRFNTLRNEEYNVNETSFSFPLNRNGPPLIFSFKEGTLGGRMT